MALAGALASQRSHSDLLKLTCICTINRTMTRATATRISASSTVITSTAPLVIIRITTTSSSSSSNTSPIADVEPATMMVAGMKIRETEVRGRTMIGLIQGTDGVAVGPRVLIAI